MFRVLNMGIGYVVIVAEDFADAAASMLIRSGERVYNIGRITRGTGQVILKE
jgi:phosphoribosylaminoimidazole (AIR) synthetase